MYVPATAFEIVTTSSWFGPLPEEPISPPSGPKTLRSQSPCGFSTTHLHVRPTGSTASLKLSQAASEAVLQPFGFGTIGAPVHDTVGLAGRHGPGAGRGGARRGERDEERGRRCEQSERDECEPGPQGPLGEAIWHEVFPSLGEWDEDSFIPAYLLKRTLISLVS